MIKTLLFTFTIILLFGCYPLKQYYVYHIESTEEIVMYNGFMGSSTDHIVVYYDFWGEDGNSDITIFNKIDYEIFIDMSRTSYIVNGFKSDYKYYTPFDYLCIPSRTKVFIQGSEIVRTIPYTHKDKIFNFLNTPLEFKFHIVYSYGDSLYTHVNEFHTYKVYLYDRSTEKITKRLEREPNVIWVRKL